MPRNLELSIIVVSYNHQRELPRTLYSLSPAYQCEMVRDGYEVIVVDNGSLEPPAAASFADLGLNLHVLVCPDPQISPAAAINQGLRAAAGRYLAVMIDGARMVSPGLLCQALQALRISPRAVVAARGRYLGPGRQSITMRLGYNQRVEDKLLARSEWKHNGYRLFEISTFDESSGISWFDERVTESNTVFMARDFWQELGGYDERFQLKGGGLVNLDLWKRACESPGALPIMLLGEASFHQFHGGVSTNNPDQNRYWRIQCQDYERIRGLPFSIVNFPLRFWGSFRYAVRREELVGGWRALGPTRIPARVKDVLKRQWRRLSGRL